MKYALYGGMFLLICAEVYVYVRFRRYLNDHGDEAVDKNEGAIMQRMTAMVVISVLLLLTAAALLLIR